MDPGCKHSDSKVNIKLDAGGHPHFVCRCGQTISHCYTCFRWVPTSETMLIEVSPSEPRYFCQSCGPLFMAQPPVLPPVRDPKIVQMEKDVRSSLEKK